MLRAKSHNILFFLLCCLMFTKTYGQEPHRENGCVSEYTFLIDRDGKISTFNSNTGNLLWEKRYEQTSYCRGTIYNDKLLFVTSKGIYLLEPETGNEIWSFVAEALESVQKNPPLSAADFSVAGDTLLVGGNNIYRFDLLNRTLIDKAFEKSSLTNSYYKYYEHNDTLFYFSAGLQAVKRSENTSLWYNGDTAEEYPGNVIISGDQLYYLTRNTFISINKTTGETVWKTEAFVPEKRKGAYLGNFAIGGNSVYLLLKDKVAVFDKTNGHLLQEIKTPGIIDLAIINNRLYWASNNQLLITNLQNMETYKYFTLNYSYKPHINSLNLLDSETLWISSSHNDNFFLNTVSNTIHYSDIRKDADEVLLYKNKSSGSVKPECSFTTLNIYLPMINNKIGIRILEDPVFDFTFRDVSRTFVQNFYSTTIQKPLRNSEKLTLQIVNGSLSEVVSYAHFTPDWGGVSTIKIEEDNFYSPPPVAESYAGTSLHQPPQNTLVGNPRDENTFKIDRNPYWVARFQGKSTEDSKNNLESFISHNYKNLPDAVRENLKGNAKLTFIVSKFGQIFNIKIKEGIGLYADEQAITLIKKMNKYWIPAFNKEGEPVDSMQEINIRF